MQGLNSIYLFYLCHGTQGSVWHGCGHHQQGAVPWGDCSTSPQWGQHHWCHPSAPVWAATAVCFPDGVRKAHLCPCLEKSLPLGAHGSLFPVLCTRPGLGLQLCRSGCCVPPGKELGCRQVMSSSAACTALPCASPGLPIPESFVNNVKLLSACSSHSSENQCGRVLWSTMGPVQGAGCPWLQGGTQRSAENQPVWHRAIAGAAWDGAEPGPALLGMCGHGAISSQPSPWPRDSSIPRRCAMRNQPQDGLFS